MANRGKRIRNAYDGIDRDGFYDIAEAVKMIKPKQVIPDHYNTWPLIEQDADAWAQRVKNETDTQPLVLSPGESCQLP